MKITLFSYNSSYSHTNLAIRCIRSALESKGNRVSIVESTEKDSYEKTLFSLLSEKADVIGFSCYIWNISATERLAKDVRALCPNVKIVFGGPEVSFYGEEFFDSHPYVDTLIRGEGEGAFLSLAEDFRDGIVDGGVFEGFCEAGIHYRKDDTLRSNIVYYESSRGCPFRCSYCLSGAETGLRMKGVEKTLEDLRAFESLDGIKIVKLVDRTFNADKKRAYRIWEALLSDTFTKNYHFEICASLVDEETVALLSRFPKGKIQLEIGVQSTNEETLRAINRHDEVKKVLDITKRLYSLGNIHIHADLIAGLPYEGIDSFERSFNDLYGKCDMLQLGFLKLLHGSPLESETERHGYVFSSHPPYRVLENKYISREELFLLDRIEKAHDRYSTGRFIRSISVLCERAEPFALFRAIAESVDDLSRLSQPRAYTELYALAERMGAADDIFTDALRLDYLLNETSRLPREIALTSLTEKEARASFLAENADFFGPALEIYAFPSDADAFFFIDRKNKKYKRIPQNRIGEGFSDHKR